MRIVVVAGGAAAAAGVVRRALQGHVVLDAASVHEAVELTGPGQVDLIVVIWPADPPPPTGGLRRLLQAPCPSIVALPAERVLERRMLSAAGIRYVPFPVDRDELTTLVRGLEDHDTDATTWVGDICIDRDQRRVTRAGRPLALTRKEFDLLEHMVRHRRVVQSKDQLLRAVWGSSDYSLNVVEVAMSGLRRKLEADGPRVLQTIRGVGYLFSPPGPEDAPALTRLMDRRRGLLEDRRHLIEERDRLVGRRPARSLTDGS